MLALLALLLPAGVSEARAQSITVVSTPTLTVSDAVPGSPPAAVTGNGTIQISTGLLGQYKIAARLMSALPTGVSLTLEITGQGSSLGAKVLTTTAQDMVNGLGAMLSNANATVTYTLSATAGAGVHPSTLASVELSIAAY